MQKGTKQAKLKIDCDQGNNSKKHNSSPHILGCLTNEKKTNNDKLSYIFHPQLLNNSNFNLLTAETIPISTY
jgi:hypothetical protein